MILIPFLLSKQIVSAYSFLDISNTKQLKLGTLHIYYVFLRTLTVPIRVGIKLFRHTWFYSSLIDLIHDTKFQPLAPYTYLSAVKIHARVRGFMILCSLFESSVSPWSSFHAHLSAGAFIAHADKTKEFMEYILEDYRQNRWRVYSQI